MAPKNAERAELLVRLFEVINQVTSLMVDYAVKGYSTYDLEMARSYLNRYPKPKKVDCGTSKG